VYALADQYPAAQIIITADIDSRKSQGNPASLSDHAPESECHGEGHTMGIEPERHNSLIIRLR